jgi:folate-binding protein YgfZ
LAEVLSGVSMVQASTQEHFVPQMLNYESVEGVSFKKGCYPGQEVVARSQFRGTIKRRAFIVSCEAPLSVAQEIFASDDETQACGTVSSAAQLEATSTAPAGTWWGIASLQLSALEHKLTLGSSTGPQVHLHALPYPLLEDI